MNGPLLYFAYGSNMNPGQMAARCPGAAFVCRATLAHHKLDFTRDSPVRRCGVADIVASPSDRVWGVVWRVTAEHIDTLDRLEGHRPGEDAYRRIDRQVEVADGPRAGSLLEVQTYEVARKIPFVRPKESYLALIIAGARHWGLPSGWLRELEAVETVTDSD